MAQKSKKGTEKGKAVDILTLNPTWSRDRFHLNGDLWMGKEFVYVGKSTCQIPLSLHKQYRF